MGAASSAAGPGAHIQADNLSAGGDINLGVNYYLASPTGLDPLPLQLRTSVGNFLHRYLGTPEKPVPFGGREVDLQRLEAWRAASDSRFLLLAAPSGRGKSALLTHWAARLSAGPAVDEVAVVFVPISIRFRTNLPDLIFPCIAVQLAGLLGEELPSTSLHTKYEHWQNLVGEYLRRPLPGGRQLLLILDGLDEAAWDIGPDFFPHHLPDSTRVAVSARYLGGETPTPAHWLGRLGWEDLAAAEALALDPLTAEGVGEVLVSMGNPLDALAEKEWVVEQLYRLTGGDPLLVELYVQDLTRRGDAVARLRPEDLAGLKPGYSGYFRRWWADQELLWAQQRRDPREQEAALALLYLLAMSKGPLSAADLSGLAPALLGTRMAIDRAVRPWQRWLQGDGRAVGLAFAHPKLADYFREEHMTAHERAQWGAAYGRWGRDTLAALPAEGGDVSPYLMQYYARHLRDAAAPPEDYLPLLTPAWAESWHRIAGSYSGFVGDVGLVLDQLQAADRQAVARGDLAPYIGQEILCVLLLSSVNNLSANMPLELLMALRRFGGWTDDQVLAYARQMPDVRERCLVLLALVPSLKRERQKGILVEVLSAAHTIGDEWSRTEVLSELASHLPAEVIAAARAIEDEGSRARLLGTLALQLPEAKKAEVLAEALAAARSIEDEGARARVLSAQVPRLPEAKRAEVLAEALAAAWSIEDEGARARVLSTLAPQLPEAKKAEVLAEALAAARATEDEGARARVLSALAPQLPEAKKAEVLAEALAAARSIEDEGPRAWVLRALVEHQAEAVLGEARDIGHEGARAQVLRALVEHLPQAVLGEARAIENGQSRVQVLSELLPHLPEAERVGVVAEALVAARVIEYEQLKAEVLSKLAPHLPEAERVGVLAEALVAARAIEDEGYLAGALIALAPYLPAEVLKTARAIGEEWSKAEVLSELPPYLPEAERAEVLAEALAAAQGIWLVADRARVLSVLAPYLPEAERAGVLAEALAAARATEYEGVRAQVMSELAPHLPEAERAGVLGEALTAARAIEHKNFRARVLSELAPHLPEAERAGVLAEALAAARATEYEGSRARVLSELAPHLPEAERAGVLAEALAAARAIKDEGSRAHDLSELAPQLPEAERAEVLAEALAAARVSGYDAPLATVLSVLVPQLPESGQEGVGAYMAAQTHEKLLAEWQALLTDLQQMRRQAALEVIAAWLPIIERLGGTAALRETLRAVELVYAWLP